MWAYGAIGLLAALTGGLGNALVIANLAFFQGTLGLTAVEAAWIPAAYVTTNVCANLVLVKFRQQFGLGLFIKLVLIFYILTVVTHLFVHGFWSAILIRAASGIAAAGLITLGILAMFQAFSAPKRLYAILIGISVPQLATPIARMIAPGLLEWGDWRMAYFFELGLALLTLAAVLALPLPPSEREKAFERTDFITIGLLFPGFALLCAALALGRTLWWTSQPWIGWALIGAIVLITAGIMIEHRRDASVADDEVAWPMDHPPHRTHRVFVRILLSEQTFGSIGLLSALGMGVDQFQTLVCHRDAGFDRRAGYSDRDISPAVASPRDPGRVPADRRGGLHGCGSDQPDEAGQPLREPGIDWFWRHAFHRPRNGDRHFSHPSCRAAELHQLDRIIQRHARTSAACLGSAIFGTLQTVREKFHSHVLVEQVLLTNPTVADRLSEAHASLSGVITDPLLRSAQGAALVGRDVAREANILAYNDVFMVIGILACLMFLWGISIELRMRRRGEISPIILLVQRLAAMASGGAKEEQPA